MIKGTQHVFFRPKKGCQSISCTIERVDTNKTFFIVVSENMTRFLSRMSYSVMLTNSTTMSLNLHEKFRYTNNDGRYFVQVEIIEAL